MDKVKQWKPGQIITVNNIVYRIKRKKSGDFTHPCRLCKLLVPKHEIGILSNYICHKLCSVNSKPKIPAGCYLEKLKER